MFFAFLCCVLASLDWFSRRIIGVQSPLEQNMQQHGRISIFTSLFENSVFPPKIGVELAAGWRGVHRLAWTTRRRIGSKP